MGIEAFGLQVRELAKAHDQGEFKTFGQRISSINPSPKNDAVEETAASLKQASDVAILQASLEVNLSAGNQPMALLFKSAIEGINEALEETMGSNAIQNAYESGIDVSPEATADRIVSMSTAFFAAYQEQHPELGIDEALDSFVSLISGGIDQGFNEAREILDGLQVLNGEIASNIDKTYTLVQEGLKSFAAEPVV